MQYNLNVSETMAGLSKVGLPTIAKQLLDIRFKSGVCGMLNTVAGSVKLWKRENT
jgi:hypothetical protein